jgi:ribosomal protein S18 acetylase RimI-like enzyme
MIRNGANAVEPIATQHGTLRTRPETAADAPFLLSLHDSVKGAELARMPVSDAVRRELLDMQFRAMTMGYRSGFPTGQFDIITLDDVPIGRLITDDGQGRFRIVYIALLPVWRNRGIGTALMTAVLDRPRRLGSRCEAIVASDNQASRRLWLRLGFAERERDGADLLLEWPPGAAPMHG